MRRLIVMATILFPLAVHAQAIGQQTLNETSNNCLAKCRTEGSSAFCSRMCECVVDRMAKEWAQEDFDNAVAGIEGKGMHATTQIEEFVRKCAQGARTAQ